MARVSDVDIFDPEWWRILYMNILCKSILQEELVIRKRSFWGINAQKFVTA
jgi:hypothetical protein